MEFLLKSEIERRKQYYCPSCRKTQIKKLNKTNKYTKYACWNKYCENVDVPFAIINDFIHNEQVFDLFCEECGEDYTRSLEIEDNHSVLTFRCSGKFCTSSYEAFQYDLNSEKWTGNIPRFKIYEDETDFISVKRDKKGITVSRPKDMINIPINNPESKLHKVCNDHITNTYCPLGEMPILSLDLVDYNKFLEYHNHKVIILVDVPNFIRTLRDYYPHNFERILNKAYTKLHDFIQNSFTANNDYLIRYYSKPDEDLIPHNEFIRNICKQNPLNEFFHLLKINKSGHYSDIDNYLMVSGVEILERCDLKGFIIVSSDKDYLPVMRVAAHKEVKKYIYGINTAELYQDYGITDIQILGVLNFLKEH